MALKKSDLYSSLWKSCDELRGGMDASQYKDYILTLLFVKYVSDKQKSDPHSLIDVPAGGSFDDMIALDGDKEIGDKINKIIGKLAEANELQKVIDLADFNDEEKLGKGKEMQDRLSKLVKIFAELDFQGSSAEGDDLLGDAYEYLMRHFATESGKSKGQFYTPAEVSRILAKVVGIDGSTKQDQTVYDPTCGSGSLLLKVAAEAPRGITIYGQEKDNATWALSKMNMILHGNEDAVIAKGDTITSPEFVVNGSQLATFDFAVSNPPFSVKSWNSGLENDFGRFEFGHPPEKNGDYAFLLHMLKSLKSGGRGAIILPHGVLFRGNAEADIRRRLLAHGYIKGIIGLPANLFYGTGIPACIIVMDKHNSQGRKGVFIVDASKGYVKDGSKNRLRSQDIHKIVDVFTKQLELPRYSRMVSLEEIGDSANDYNLNITRYIDSAEPDDIQDLRAHLYGGIPERDIEGLNAYWKAFPALRESLFTSYGSGYGQLGIAVDQAHQFVLDSAEFRDFRDRVADISADWFEAHRPSLQNITSDTRTADLIATMGDDLLENFDPIPLIDKYDVYERLMSYWGETMHDDLFLVMNDGWVMAAAPRAPIEDKNRKLNEAPDLIIGSGRSAAKFKMDLIPPILVTKSYFAEAQNEIDLLLARSEQATQEIEDFVDEYGGDEGQLAGALDGDKITRALAAARLRVAKREDVDKEEIDALERIINLYDVEAAARRATKDAEAELDRKVLEKYGQLSEQDIRSLVIGSKWKATVMENIIAEVDALALLLVDRIHELGTRYESPLSEIVSRVELLAVTVDSHLHDMESAWS